MKIRQESFPQRCEICHQADLFNAEQNYCQRCANLPAAPDQAASVSTNSNIRNARQQWRLDNRFDAVSIGSLAGCISGGIGSALLTLFYILTNFPGDLVKLIIAVILAIIISIPGLIFGAIVGATIGQIIKFFQLYNRQVNLTLIGAAIGFTFSMPICLLLYAFLTLPTELIYLLLLLITVTGIIAGGVAGDRINRAIPTED